MYRFINQLVYICIFKKSNTKIDRNIVNKLSKNVYSLKQLIIQKLGLSQINIDHSIFMSKADFNSQIISTFIDNIKIIAPKKSRIIKQVKVELTTIFLMVDMSSISFYLKPKVEQNQQKQIIKLF